RAERLRNRDRPQQSDQTHDDHRNANPVQGFVRRVLMALAVFGKPLLHASHDSPSYLELSAYATRVLRREQGEHCIPSLPAQPTADREGYHGRTGEAP